MIGAIWIPSLTALCGVVLGSGLTWLVQRNEWGRQRRWELRRDAALDALRALADLENALTEFDATFTVPLDRCTDDARAVLANSQHDAIEQFRKGCSAYKRAHIVADLAVGGMISKNFSAYFQFALPLVGSALPKRRGFLDEAAPKKELALRGNAVTMSAREALGIKDAGDLPLLGDSN
jgi:hypothetical protein